LLAFDEAQKRVLALAEVLGPERVAIPAAVGRVLTGDVRASFDAPAFDTSTMDGYAVRANDVDEAALRITGESRAGASAPALPPRSACRIFTGAALPREADAVVMQEDADRDGDFVRFRTRPGAGAFVRRRGEDLKAGDVALSRGARIGAREVALLSSLDLADVDVTRAPSVTIVPTGDELRSPGAASVVPAVTTTTTIPESNSRALAVMATHAGARVDVRPSVRDDADEVRRAVGDALRSCDVLVTIGGVSVGEHDLVRGALDACGVALDFWRVALKPGKPLAVGRHGHAVVLGLPGNPVSAMLTFAMFGVPLLRAMQGDARPLPRTWRAKLGKTILRTPSERLELARAQIDEQGAVVLLAQQASAAIIGLCLADVVVCIPPGTQQLEAGAAVDVYSISELGL
jgi:molybdopterin molybdotransferase